MLIMRVRVGLVHRVVWCLGMRVRMGVWDYFGRDRGFRGWGTEVWGGSGGVGGCCHAFAAALGAAGARGAGDGDGGGGDRVAAAFGLVAIVGVLALVAKFLFLRQWVSNESRKGGTHCRLDQSTLLLETFYLLTSARLFQWALT